MSNAVHEWDGKINNHAQVGGIETSVLDNGLGKRNTHCMDKYRNWIAI